MTYSVFGPIHVLKESHLDQLAPLWDQLEALWRQSSDSNPPLEDSQNQEDGRVTKSDATAEESESDNHTEGKDDVVNNQDGRDFIEELLVVEEDFKKGEEVETRKSDDGLGVEDSLKETIDSREAGSSSSRDVGIQTKEGEEDFGVKETNLMVDGEENGKGEEVLKEYVQDGGGVNQEEETTEDSGLEISEHQDSVDLEDFDFMKAKEDGQDAKGRKVKKKGKGAKVRKAKKNGTGADIRKAKEDGEGAKAIGAKEDGEVMESRTKSEEEVESLPPRVLILWTDLKLHEEVRRLGPLVSMVGDSGWGL